MAKKTVKRSTTRSKQGSSSKKAIAKKAPRKRPALTDDAFQELKQAALERSLGPMHKTVLHAIIPFSIGGGLDLYPFQKAIPGTVYATQELISLDRKARPKAGKLGHFELVACLPPGAPIMDKKGITLINQLLNPSAMYAYSASLNPGETAEVPVDEKGTTRNMLLDLFGPLKTPFEFAGEKFHLLLCMAIHPSELAYARKHSFKKLIELLKAAGAYPYSDLKRKPVA